MAEPVSPVIPDANVSEVTYAKDQPQYLKSGKSSSKGYIYLEVLTFNRPLQPLRLSAELPEGFSPIPIAEVWA